MESPAHLLQRKLVIHRADGTPVTVCCTPEEAQEWCDLVQDDPHLYKGALRHLREVQDAWLE